MAAADRQANSAHCAARLPPHLYYQRPLSEDRNRAAALLPPTSCRSPLGPSSRMDGPSGQLHPRELAVLHWWAAGRVLWWRSNQGNSDGARNVLCGTRAFCTGARRAYGLCTLSLKVDGCIFHWYSTPVVRIFGGYDSNRGGRNGRWKVPKTVSSRTYLMKVGVMFYLFQEVVFLWSNDVVLKVISGSISIRMQVSYTS